LKRKLLLATAAPLIVAGANVKSMVRAPFSRDAAHAARRPNLGQHRLFQDLGQAVPEVIDLGGEARDRCLAETGRAPRRPHMMALNPSFTHAIISFVGTGHVLFVITAARQEVGCVDAGAQVHFAAPHPTRDMSWPRTRMAS